VSGAKRSARHSLVAVSALLLACGAGDDTSSTAKDTGGGTDTDVVVDAGDDSLATDTGTALDTGTAPDVGGDADPWGTGYPAGPYGINAGQVLAGLDWEGYVNDKADAVSTTKPFVPTSLDKLRRKGNYGILHVAEFL